MTFRPIYKKFAQNFLGEVFLRKKKGGGIDFQKSSALRVGSLCNYFYRQ